MQQHLNAAAVGFFRDFFGMFVVRENRNCERVVQGKESMGGGAIAT
jgi:hypothetical protein